MADNQAGYTPGPEEWLKIPVHMDEQAIRNAARELRMLWLYLEDVHPQAKLKVTKDARGYNLYLNGQALRYIIQFASKLQPLNLSEDKPINLDEIPF